jgi:protein-tyrosine phosphatase
LIDTHCHLLPGLDDGPRRASEALDLARRLVADGVEHVLCTPHYSSLFPTSDRDASTRFRELNAQLASESIPLRTSLAAEIGPGFAASAPIEKVLARTVAGRFALIEVLSVTSPSALLAIRDRLADAGVKIILAHPERSRAVQRHPNVVDPLRADGALVQVVAPSLLGRWGSDVEVASWRLVDTGRADLLGSDAHGASRRRPHLREASELIEGRLGEGVVIELTERGPTTVLAGDADAY